MKLNNNTLYLDAASTQPMAPQVLDVMTPWLLHDFANPASVHPNGLHAREALEQARQRCALYLGCHADELMFTSGGTESNNLVLQGLLKAGDHLIVGETEHAAVLDVARFLEATRNVEVTYLPVNRDGLYTPEALRTALRPNTALVSLMLANNETGVLQPLPALARVCQQAKVPLHSDMVQSVGKTAVQLHALGVQYASFSSHKFGGPRGHGLLFKHHQAPPLTPLLYGGQQEQGIRSGTVSTANALGCATALELWTPEHRHTLEQRSDAFIERWQAYLSSQQYPQNACLNTPINGKHRIAGLVNISLPPWLGDQWVNQLGLRGIAIASGSACHESSLTPSHVLLAMQRSHAQAGCALRFSFTHHTTPQDLETVFQTVLKLHQKQL